MGNAALLGPLRLAPIELCVAGDRVWLRGERTTAELERRLRALPAERFRVLEDGALIAEGRRLSSGRLPEGPWQRLQDWLACAAPIAHLATAGARPSPWRLERGGECHEPGALRVRAELWFPYAIRVPEARLDRWRFAADQHGEVVVVGEPLPALPGDAHWLREGVATPVGYRWIPAVEPRVLADALGIGEGDIALLQLDGRWDWIPASRFVRATRQALRRTEEAWRAQVRGS